MYASSGMVIFEDLVTFEDNVATVRPPVHLHRFKHFRRETNPPTVTNALVHTGYIGRPVLQFFRPPIASPRSLIMFD